MHAFFGLLLSEIEEGGHGATTNCCCSTHCYSACAVLIDFLETSYPYSNIKTGQEERK